MQTAELKVFTKNLKGGMLEKQRQSQKCVEQAGSWRRLRCRRAS